MADGIKRITERVTSPFSGSKVNREAGTIDDVLICGLESVNGRDYPDATHRRDHKKYEGCPANCDHGKEATIDRRLGWFTNTYPASDGTRGRFNCLKSHPMYERVMEAAERNPALFGFSHVAHCKTRRDPNTGREIVESIERVESIDLVAEPATTHGFFEGKGVKLSVKALCEALVKHPKTKAKSIAPLKQLAEMDGMDSAPVPLDAPPADEADPADGVKEAFKTAVMHLVDKAMSGGLDPKEALSKIKKLLASHGEVNGSDPAPADDDDYTSTPEGKRKTANPLDVIEEARKLCGPTFTPGTALLKALCKCETVEERTDLLNEHRAATGKFESAKGAGRFIPAGTAATNKPEPKSLKELREFVSAN